MFEIKIIGRGGQGGKKMAKIIAWAAFLEGREVQSFALYGAERRGAPVMSFTRIDNKPIEVRGYINNPDLIIVLDDSLMEMALDGFSYKNAKMIVNSNKDSSENITSIDATQIALDIIGKPIFNTTMLGAFVKVTGIVSIESIIEAIKQEFEKMPERIVVKNVKACERAYKVI